jgi:hypothetical protein
MPSWLKQVLFLILGPDLDLTPTMTAGNERRARRSGGRRSVLTRHPLRNTKAGGWSWAIIKEV